jgi:rhodanese-related sulfurtransferase
MSYAGDLTPEQAWQLLEDNPDAVLVDVRTRAEWDAVGVPDTAPLGREAAFVEWVTLPARRPNPAFLEELEEVGLEPGEGRPVVFLCRSGQRSIAAAMAATAAGFGPAYNVLEGFEGAGGLGMSGWRAAGLPWRRR